MTSNEEVDNEQSSPIGLSITSTKKRTYSLTADNVSADRMATYITQKDVGVSLEDIPNIGPKTAQKLKAYGIEEPITLYGYLLAFYNAELGTQAYCDRIKSWMCDTVGVQPGMANRIIRRTLIKLSQVYFPGIYEERDLQYQNGKSEKEDNKAEEKNVDVSGYHETSNTSTNSDQSSHNESQEENIEDHDAQPLDETEKKEEEEQKKEGERSDNRTKSSEINTGKKTLRARSRAAKRT
jgi:hypothetical protein